MKGSTAWIGVMSFAKKRPPFGLIAEERTGHSHLIALYDDDGLALQQLFGDNRAEAA